MGKYAVTKSILEVPDRYDSVVQSEAGGDVVAENGRETESFLRAIAAQRPASCSASLRYDFSPDATDQQSRLGMFLTIAASGENAVGVPTQLLRLGPIDRFYRTSLAEVPLVRWEDFPFACEIVRRIEFVRSAVSTESNPRVLPDYCLIPPFKANGLNDYIKLDKVNAQITEKTLTEIRVEPTDTSPERMASLKYLARLQSVNYPREEEWPAAGMDYLGEGGEFASAFRSYPRIRDQHDPMADMALQVLRRFQESLLKPCLLFRICVLAASEAAAMALASTVAECAFRNGAYRLSMRHRGTPRYDALIAALRDGKMITAGLPDAAGAPQALNIYKDFERIAGMATVEELAGAFRLPVAGHCSPYCFRKTTDPPPSPAIGALRIGFLDRGQRGEDIPESARVWMTIPHLTLTKNTGIFGKVGCGKTSLVESLILQLGRESDGGNKNE